jgi:hypothetical protein
MRKLTIFAEPDTLVILTTTQSTTWELIQTFPILPHKKFLPNCLPGEGKHPQECP